MCDLERARQLVLAEVARPPRVGSGDTSDEFRRHLHALYARGGITVTQYLYLRERRRWPVEPQRDLVSVLRSIDVNTI